MIDRPQTLAEKLTLSYKGMSTLIFISLFLLVVFLLISAAQHDRDLSMKGVACAASRIYSSGCALRK